MATSVDSRTCLVSVIICTRNRVNEVATAVHAVATQAAVFDDVEIVVVDNGSSDDTRARVGALQVASRCRIRYILEPVVGLGRARNAGRSQALGCVVAFLDDDALPHAGWVNRLRSHFLGNVPDCLAGRIVARPTGGVPSWFPRSLLFVLGETELGEEPRILPPSLGPAGGNFAIRASAFDRIGGFSARQSLYFDEVEFMRRARALGIECYYRPDICVDHCVPPARLSKNALRRRAWMMGDGAARALLARSESFVQRLAASATYSGQGIALALLCLLRPRFDREFTAIMKVATARRLLIGG